MAALPDFLGSSWPLVLFKILLIVLTASWASNLRKKRFRLPRGPRNVPILGCLPFIDHRKPWLTFSKWADQYGKMFYVKFGSDSVVFVNDYKLLKEVFSHEKCQHRPETPGTKLREIESGGHNGLVFSVGEEWKEHRRFVLRSFKDFGIGRRTIEDKIAEEAEYLLNMFRKQEEPFNNKVFISTAVANVICQVLCNTRHDADDPVFVGLITSMSRLFQTDFNTAMIQSYMWLRFVPPFKWTFEELNGHAMKISAYFKKMTKDHSENWNPNEEQDLMDSYITAVKRKEYQTFAGTYFVDSLAHMDTWKDNELDVEVQLPYLAEDLMEAGFETTTTALRWSFLLMCVHPDIQRKVQDELDAKLPKGALMAKPSDQLNLPYTEAVLAEVHRYSSFIPQGVLHSAAEDVSFDSYDIPKGSWIMANVFYIHHDPKLWDEPDEFRPERFIGLDGKVNQSMDYFIPFSIGKRKCPGESLARWELYMFFTAILNAFTLSLPEPVDLTPVAGITLDTPFHKIKLAPRVKCS